VSSLFLVNKRQRQREASESWWFNTKSMKSEFGLLTAAPYRIGPFDTEAEADKAMDAVRERARSWAAEDADEAMDRRD